MAVIVTRAGKGSPLTNNEVDANFINLNTELGLKASAGANSDITSLSGLTGGISTADYIDIDTAATPTGAVARMRWDDGNGTLQIGMKGGNVNLQVGQEILARVYNDSGAALTDGQIVYISGSQGNRIAVKLANANSEATSAGTLGMVTEPIAIGAEGFINIMGVVNGLNTSALTAGQLVYLSTTAGAYTTTAPLPPNHRVIVGYVERVHATVGSIYVKVDNGYELEELHNVSITSLANNDILQYHSASSLWKNVTPATARTNLGLAIGTNVQAWDTHLDQIAALAPTADNVIVGNGTSWVLETPAQARTSLGVAIGTNVQAWDADLDAIAALAGASGFLKKTAANTWSLDTSTYLTTAVTSATGTANQIAVSASTGAVTFSLPATINVNTTGNATTATTATNIAGGAASQIHYQSAAGTTAFITAPTVTSSVLSWNGTAFAWATVGGATISDDTTTAATYYPTFATATSGTFSTAKVSSTKLTFNPSTGTLTAVAVTASSDESLKTDWQNLAEDFVDRLAQTKHGVFTRIAEGTVEAGVSAQSWQTILPQTVVKGNDGLLSVAYGNAALVSAIQLAKRLVALEATVAKLVD